jgi:hypothetical protein
VTNKQPAKREPSRQPKGSGKPEILVGRWSEYDWKADLARRKARKVRLHALKAEKKAQRAKQAVTPVRPVFQEETDRLRAENETLREQRKVPKARKSKAEKSDRFRSRRGRVRKKKRKRDLHPKPRVISTPMGGQPGFRR